MATRPLDPAGGLSPLLALRVPRTQLARLEQAARTRGLRRQELARQLLAAGLDRLDEGKEVAAEAS